MYHFNAKENRTFTDLKKISLFEYYIIQIIICIIENIEKTTKEVM